jgi:hypothetical protein
VGDEEKAHLRRKLVTLIDQEDSQIAVQVAVVLARVARLDYPRAWPSLFNDLLGRLPAGGGAPLANGGGGAGSGGAAIVAAGTLTSRRVYLALHHTLKELASKRLASDQRAFEAVAAQLLDPLWAQWGADTATLEAALPAALAAGGGAASQQALLLTLERWLLQLKALRRLLLHGAPSDAKTMLAVAAVARCAPPMLRALHSLVAIRAAAAAGAPRTQLAAMLDRGALKLLKTLRQVQEVQPWSTLHCGALVPALEFACARVTAAPAAPPAGGRAAQQLLQQCLMLIAQAVRCAAYRGSPASLVLGAGQARGQMEQLKALAAEARAPLAAFWAERQGGVVEALVGRLFPLTAAELADWEDAPEEFHRDAEHAAWEESVRGCAEQAFAALLEAYRPALAPLVVAMLQRAEAACPPGAAAAAAAGAGAGGGGPPPALLAKEAVYRAVAVGAYELHDFVDLSAWLRRALLAEACDGAAAARPLRRGAMRVLAHWAPKLRAADRPAVYAALVGALGYRDAAVVLAAVGALRALVDDWEFAEAPFAEFTRPCLALLARVLGNSAELETQVEVFGLMGAIVDRLGEGVVPHAGALLALLPGVWAGGGGQSLLRIQVLVALARLVQALGPASPSAYPVVLPILGEATHPAQPDGLNLLEDGLHLWLVALRHAPAPHPGLLAPLPHLLAALRASTEHAGLGMRCAASAVLLGGRGALAAQGQGAALVAVLEGYVGNVKERGMLALLPVLELLVQAFPGEGPALAAPALRALLADLLAGREPAAVVAAALRVFARLLLHNPPAFLQLFADATPHVAPPAAAAAADGADPAQRLLLSFLDLWLDRVDAIGQAAARKLSALALCALLPAPLPPLLARLDLIAAHVTAVWFEMEGPEAGGGAGYGAEYFAAAAAPRDDDIHAAVNSEEAEGEAGRRRALLAADPVPALALAAFCKSQLEAAAGAHGGALNAALNALDPALGAQLKAMLDSAP